MTPAEARARTVSKLPVRKPGAPTGGLATPCVRQNSVTVAPCHWQASAGLPGLGPHRRSDVGGRVLRQGMLRWIELKRSGRTSVIRSGGRRRGCPVGSWRGTGFLATQCGEEALQASFLFHSLLGALSQAAVRPRRWRSALVSCFGTLPQAAAFAFRATAGQDGEGAPLARCEPIHTTADCTPRGTTLRSNILRDRKETCWSHCR